MRVNHIIRMRTLGAGLPSDPVIGLHRALQPRSLVVKVGEANNCRFDKRIGLEHRRRASIEPKYAGNHIGRGSECRVHPAVGFERQNPERSQRIVRQERFSEHKGACECCGSSSFWVFIAAEKGHSEEEAGVAIVNDAVSSGVDHFWKALLENGESATIGMGSTPEGNGVRSCLRVWMLPVDHMYKRHPNEPESAGLAGRAGFYNEHREAEL